MEKTSYDPCCCIIGVQVFRPRTPPEAIALCSRLLEYTPTARLTPLEACAHSFFDELRDPNVKLPNGREKPSLFNFTTQGTHNLILLFLIYGTFEVVLKKPVVLMSVSFFWFDLWLTMRSAFYLQHKPK